jgi:hypothetical protein
VADHRLSVVAAASFPGPAEKAPHQFLIVNGELKRRVQPPALGAKDVVQLSDLRGRARVAVE